MNKMGNGQLRTLQGIHERTHIHKNKTMFEQTNDKSFNGNGSGYTWKHMLRGHDFCHAAPTFDPLINFWVLVGSFSKLWFHFVKTNYTWKSNMCVLHNMYIHNFYPLFANNYNTEDNWGRMMRKRKPCDVWKLWGIPSIVSLDQLIDKALSVLGFIRIIR